MITVCWFVKMDLEKKKIMVEETIFQVRINRDDGSFELAKASLENDFEQAGLEVFLKTYLTACNNTRLENFELV